MYRNSLFFATNQEKMMIHPGLPRSVYRRRTSFYVICESVSARLTRFFDRIPSLVGSGSYPAKIPAWQKQGFFRFPRTPARFRNDHASNWCYLMIFLGPFHTESSQTGLISGISQNNSAAFSRISVKNPTLILKKGKTHRGVTVGET